MPIPLANEQKNSFKGFNIRRDKIKQSYDIRLLSFNMRNYKSNHFQHKVFLNMRSSALILHSLSIC